MLVKKVQQKYEALFESTPRIFRSPASINLLGEHASYNEGTIIQAAINKEIIFAAAANQSDIGRVYAIDREKLFEFNVDSIEKSDDIWSNHILGIIKEFRNEGLIIGGFDCVLASDIPLGSGLSSSIALMGGLGYLLNHIFELGISPEKLAKYTFKAKTSFVGSTGFYPAHLVNMLAKTNHFMIADFKNNTQDYLESDLPNARIILFDPQEKIAPNNTILSKRFAECEEALAIVNKYFPEVKSLTACHQDMLLKCKDELGPVLFRRASFVINENARSIQGAEDLKKNRLGEFGKRMYASHTALRSEYELNKESIDFLVENVKPYQAVLGAKMMGLGNGGCAIVLLKDDDLNVFVNDIQKKFKKKFRRDLLVYKFKIAKSTGEVSI